MNRLLILPLAATIALSAFAENVFRRPMERVASLDPLRAGAVYDSRVCGLLYSNLLEVDYFKRPYELRPGYAEMPEVSEDGLVYTFHLKGGRFAAPANREIEAEDVVWSLKRLADRKNASSGMWIMADVAEVEAPDAKTIRIRLTKPCHYFPWLMAMSYTAILPRDGSLSASGPYQLREWQRNHRMSFVRNPAWWQARGNEIAHPDKAPDRIEYLVIDDVSTQWLMFLSGQIDFLGEVSRDNWDAVIGPDGRLGPELEARGVRLMSTPTLDVMYIGFNMNDPVVGKNKKLRQALNCAFDSTAWKKFLNNRVEPANGPLPPGIRDGRINDPAPYSYDLEKAKRLLAEAGYPGGIDPRTGKRLVITVTIGRATMDVRESTELMASFYEKIGIVLEAKYMTWNAYMEAVKKHNVQLYRIGWVGDYPDAQNFLQLFYSKLGDDGPNHSGFANPEFDRLYETAMAAKSSEERNAAWIKAQEIVREECPWIFLNFSRSYSLIRGGIEGYQPTDFPAGSERHLWYNPAAK